MTSWKQVSYASVRRDRETCSKLSDNKWLKRCAKAVRSHATGHIVLLGKSHFSNKKNFINFSQVVLETSDITLGGLITELIV